MTWLQAAWTFVTEIDWPAALGGAALASITLGIRTIIQEPIKAATRQASIISKFWWLSKQGPLDGRWNVTWHVDSSRYPVSNSDEVRVRRLFSNVTFRTRTELNNGRKVDCVFVGKLVDKTITGRWYNPTDEERGYFGVFQVRLHAGLGDGDGRWVGWANNGDVQSNSMTMGRIY